jgi:hypothetical protein
MAYIGNTPAESYASFERQVFTIVNSQTAYTLNHAVTNENEIRLVVNNVVQEPGSGKAFTAANTTLTLSVALVNGTDEMYCVFLGRALQTVNPPAASVGNSQTAPTIITGQTAETSIATDDTILIHDTSASALRKMTRANFVSGIGGTNTPAFHAYNNADQNISANTLTQVIFNTEIYDTDSAFASNQFTVPSGKGGKYFVYFRLGFASGTDFTYQITVQINSSFNADSGFRVNQLNDYYDNHFSGQVLDLSAGDVVRVMMYQGNGTHNISGTENRANFGAYKIIT